MYYALLAYVLGAVLVFMQHNLQFMDPAYKNKQVMLILTLSYPISFCYFYAWTHFVNAVNGSVWSARFIFFGLSYLVYPILAYVCLNQTPFTLKTIICTLLSILILIIQYKL